MDMMKIAEELDDMRSVSTDITLYVHSILSAIETLSSMPDKAAVISDLAACGQYVMGSLDGHIYSACNRIAEQGGGRG